MFEYNHKQGSKLVMDIQSRYICFQETQDFKEQKIGRNSWGLRDKTQNFLELGEICSKNSRILSILSRLKLAWGSHLHMHLLRPQLVATTKLLIFLVEIGGLTYCCSKWTLIDEKEKVKSSI